MIPFACDLAMLTLTYAAMMLTLTSCALGLYTLGLWSASQRRDGHKAKQVREALKPLGFVEQTTRTGSSICAHGWLGGQAVRLDFDLAPDGRCILRVDVELSDRVEAALSLSARRALPEPWPQAPTSRGLGDEAFDACFCCLGGITQAIAQLDPDTRQALILSRQSALALSPDSALELTQGRLVMELAWRDQDWIHSPQQLTALLGQLDAMASSWPRLGDQPLPYQLLAQLERPQALAWRAQALRLLLLDWPEHPASARAAAYALQLSDEDGPALREVFDLYALDRLRWERWHDQDADAWQAALLAATLRQREPAARAALASYWLAARGPKALILAMDVHDPAWRLLLRAALHSEAWSQATALASSHAMPSMPWAWQRIIVHEAAQAGVRLELDALRAMLRAAPRHAALHDEAALGDLVAALTQWPMAHIEQDLCELLSCPSSRHQLEAARWLGQLASPRALSALKRAHAQAERALVMSVARQTRQAMLDICARHQLSLTGGLSLAHQEDASGLLSMTALSGQLSPWDSGVFLLGHACEHTSSTYDQRALEGAGWGGPSSSSSSS